MRAMNNLEDTLKDKKQRLELVKSIKEKGITDHAVLQAILSIPRQFFMDVNHIGDAYVDKAFPIGEGQTISQPYTVAYQTELLSIQPGDKVLEIGTGSGYQACVLASMQAKVFSIERQKNLFEKNQYFDYLKQFDNLRLFYGDGYEGLPEYAPFDKILITAAVDEVPDKLVMQLNMPGMMVLPLGKRPVQQMMRLRKLDNSEILEEYFDNFSFVPMLKGKK